MKCAIIGFVVNVDQDQVAQNVQLDLKSALATLVKHCTQKQA